MKTYNDYGISGEYERPKELQSVYGDKNNVQEYITWDSQIEKIKEELSGKVPNIGYIMNITLGKVTKSFYFYSCDEFRAFMAKRNIMLGINYAYAELKSEFNWPYSPEFAIDFGIEPVSQEILTMLPIGRKDLHGNI